MFYSLETNDTGTTPNKWYMFAHTTQGIYNSRCYWITYIIWCDCFKTRVLPTSYTTQRSDDFLISTPVGGSVRLLGGLFSRPAGALRRSLAGPDVGIPAVQLLWQNGCGCCRCVVMRHHWDKRMLRVRVGCRVQRSGLVTAGKRKAERGRCAVETLLVGKRGRVGLCRVGGWSGEICCAYAATGRCRRTGNCEIRKEEIQFRL